MAETWEEAERRLGAISPQTWETIGQRYDNIKPVVDSTIGLSQADINRYPKMNNNGEHLSQLLANLNYYVERLGELHSVAEYLKSWTEKRYQIEKGIAAKKLMDEKKSGTYADNAKYETVKEFLDIMVKASAIHLRVQNQRSSARDTTEGIRSRIGQLRGQLRG